MSVVVETTLGTFTVDLYTETRPKLCRNFLKLCKVKFYNFCLFHNVQSGFLAQTGDPTGTGRGGESIFRRLYGDQAIYFEGDAPTKKIRHSRPGQVSMVGINDEGTMFGSQFFMTLAGEGLDYLDTRHSVFGEVVEDEDGVLEKLNSVISDDSHRPFRDIRITHTVVLDDPFEDPPLLEIPPSSPAPDADRLRSDRLGVEDEVTDDSDADPDELAEKVAEKEARTQATILEMVGDLPDADCAPPENVLFVCKLNPVTTDDDLEIIFSRFGKVVSCEVIRDHKTGDSLQYAFVEFDSQKACETAYFKMDNVLIDDRRIHVDFSQSVAKFRWKGKGRLEVLDEDKPKKKRDARSRSPPHKKERSRSRSRERRNRHRKRSRSRSRSRERHRRKRSESKERRRGRKSRSTERYERGRSSSRQDKQTAKRPRSRERRVRSRSRERRRDRRDRR